MPSRTERIQTLKQNTIKRTKRVALQAGIVIALGGFAYLSAKAGANAALRGGELRIFLVEPNGTEHFIPMT
jgi:hypothetical protein